MSKEASRAPEDTYLPTLYKLHKKGLDCTTAKGCVSEPLLHIEERFKFAVMCILHLVICVGDYLTKFIRKKWKHLPPATRDRVQDRLNCAKTKISLKGHASPDGEETWLLLANWRHIGKAMKLPNLVIDVIVQMASLRTALQSREFNSNALNCKSAAKNFKRTICPTIRSPYLLWLQFVMEPNGDGDRDVQTMDEGESPTKADEEMVCTDAKEGKKEEDEPMQEGEQGEAKPTEDVNDKPTTPSDTSVAVAEEGKSDEAPKTNTPNKEGLDATQKLWSSPPPQ